MEIARLAGIARTGAGRTGRRRSFVKAVLNGRTPREAATALVNGTKLADPAVRRQLVDGGEAAVAASNDPMIVLARKLDPMRRELTKWLENNVESVEQRAGEQLGKARFAVYGKTTYPDATFTLRLSYGQVKGYPMNGTKAPPMTTFYGMYDRAAGFNYRGAVRSAVALPGEPRQAGPGDAARFRHHQRHHRRQLGSPVINAQAEIVGLIFDGNIESLVGDFVYDGAANRAVAVHTGAMTEALRKLYGADRLVEELSGK